MANTLPNGVVIPARGDQISASGVQEMRMLGASTDALLGFTRAEARASATDLAAQIEGMEGMSYVGAWELDRVYRINDVVTHGGDSWARLTAGSTGEPGGSATDWGLVARKGDGGGFGALVETAVPGLYDTVDNGIEARLAALEYKSGPRNITALFPEITTGSVVSSRVGRMVTTTFYGVRVSEWPSGSSFLHLGNYMPAGLRPERGHLPMVPAENGGTVGRVRIVGGSGQVTLYNGSSLMTFYASLTFPTDDFAPAIPPGSAA
ncbi:hypothetical protein [Brachybacterium sp.]|uniref:hypothetical protein n=1 Tax=Brachybacterium sp. TaxID=1891286 RepID=UPI002ED5F34C